MTEILNKDEVEDLHGLVDFGDMIENEKEKAKEEYDEHKKKSDENIKKYGVKFVDHRKTKSINIGDMWTIKRHGLCGVYYQTTYWGGHCGCIPYCGFGFHKCVGSIGCAECKYYIGFKELPKVKGEEGLESRGDGVVYCRGHLAKAELEADECLIHNEYDLMKRKLGEE